jgi:hypothetical protein
LRNRRLAEALFADLFKPEKTVVKPISGKGFLYAEGYIKPGWDLARYLRYAVSEEGFECVIVWGKPGTGKSNLARRFLYQIYGDWDKVLRCTITGIDEMLAVVREWRTTVDKPSAIVLDDISRVLSRQLWQENWRLYIAFSKALQVIRSLFNVIIVTVPDIKFIPEPIMNMQTFEVHVTPQHTYYVQRIIKVPDVYNPRRGFNYKYLIEVNRFDITDEPYEVYRRYRVKREQMAFDAMKEVEEAMSKTAKTTSQETTAPASGKKASAGIGGRGKRVLRMICLAKCGYEWNYALTGSKPPKQVRCPRCGAVNDFISASAGEAGEAVA